jgi:VWFA-related protein
MLRATLTETRAEGTTALYDAIELALRHLKDGSKQRKALVVLSDGGDNASHIKLEEALKMAEQSSATIYSIGIYDPFQKDRNPNVMKRIARVTGGESYFPSSLAEMRTIWPKIAGAIRGQYTIGYVSTNQARDGSFRKVKIVAKNNRGKMLDVRTRPGYISASAPQ